MEIRNNILDRGFTLYHDEYMKRAEEVLESGWYVLGPQLKAFETEFAAYNNAAYCVGCGSGLDALVLAFDALHLPKGSRVICPANTYIASVMGFTKLGLEPVFVEPDRFYDLDPDQLEASIDDSVSAVCAVHLYGQIAQMDRIMEIAGKHHLKVVEDCAQAHGASLHGRKCGTFGDIGCFSFYPTKLLGGFGDGGAVITDNKEYAESIRMMRNYGSREHYMFERVGYNSRLDELQAGLLRVKLMHLDELIQGRRKTAQAYHAGLKNPRIVCSPVQDEPETHVYHLFTAEVDNREKFMEYCSENHVGIAIHYPQPPHLSQAYAYLGYHRGDFPITERIADHIVSLPMYDGIREDETQYVIDVLNHYE